MLDLEIDGLAIFSAPGSMRYGQRGHVLYVSGYEPYFGDTMAILPADRDVDPVLQIDSADYFPSECTWIDEVIGARDPATALRSYVNEFNPRKMGLVGRPSTPPGFVESMKRRLRPCQFVDASHILEAERAVKTDYEIGSIRKASGIAKIGFEAAHEHARPGVTEAAVVSEVEAACRLAGSEGFPHHTMVTSGKNEKHLEWWWYCGRRKLRKGDPWNLDFGTMFNGYCCDIARSFCLGKPTERHTALYERLVEAEEAARRSMVPGIMASEVNKIVSQEMSRSFEGDFSGIGHGVGLEVHEWPFVGYEYIRNDPVYADRRLEKNMVISVEPQVYAKGLGYLQIEDEFVVTKEGGQPLSAIERGLWH